MEQKPTQVREVIYLIIIYTFSHFLICVISGQWWDDWMYWTYNSDRLVETYTKTGYPMQAYNILSVMWIPNWGYRIVVFVLFLISGLTFYHILRNIDYLSDDAFWIAAVAMNVPVNDARTVLNCFGYSLELPLFLIGFYFAVRMNSLTKKRKCIIRVLSIVILIYSYTMESLLVFTGLIWLYFFYTVWTSNENTSFSQKTLLFIKSYWDYLILPFCYYVIRRVLFPTSGRYEGHNDVSVKLLLKGIIKSPSSSIVTLSRILQSYTSQLEFISATSIVVIIVIYVLVKHGGSNNGAVNVYNPKKSMLTIILGIVVYYAGIFAYIVVLGGIPLRNISVESRHTMLAGLGISMIVIGTSRLIPLKRNIQNFIPIILIILGFFHFNSRYLAYQLDWYYQLGFKNLIEDNQAFGDDNTILCDFAVPLPSEGTRSYSLNGISYTVTGRKDKFYYPGISFLSQGLKTKDGISMIDEIVLDGNNCDDYDTSDTSIDGILFVDNIPVSDKEVLLMRLHEISGQDAFNDDIRRITDGQYLRINKKQSDRIYELYSDDTLTTEYLRALREE